MRNNFKASRISFIVFDLDGTLIDSIGDITSALNIFLSAVGRRDVNVGEVKKMMGDGAFELIERALSATGDTPGDNEIRAMSDHFMDIYNAHPIKHCKAYSGVPETLARLRSEGLTLGVCTNKKRDLTIRILDRLGLTSQFKTVIGGDSTEAIKPDTRPLLAVLEGFGAMPEEAAMVGDSGNDISMAHALGLAAVAARFGYPRTIDELAAADAFIDAFDELPAVLQSL